MTETMKPTDENIKNCYNYVPVLKEHTDTMKGKEGFFF